MADLMAAHGVELPVPLPKNRRAWSAFVRVHTVRHAPMGVMHLPNWTDIRTVLELHGLWDADTQERLALMFTEMFTMEHEQREAERG